FKKSSNYSSFLIFPRRQIPAGFIEYLYFTLFSGGVQLMDRTNKCIIIRIYMGDLSKHTKSARAGRETGSCTGAFVYSM
ncbi:MAG: hypothetical protein KHZ98_05460, partial [Actinomyces sp.]|nr:hypothetical protein [Actinomyces sp.]